MMSRKRSGLTFLSLTTLLALCLMPSCNKTATTTSNPKEELVRVLGSTDLKDFDFESTENDAQTVSSFTNRNAKNVMRLEGGTNNVVLKYTTVKDKAKNTSTSYKTELSRSGDSLAMVVTDVATGRIVSTDRFTTTEHPAGPTFDSLEDCIKDFDCKHKGALQCEANRTCKDQFAGLTCCLKNGQCFSVHLIVRPTRLICQLLPWLTNFEAAVFSRQTN